jgi:hypothetical protein
MCKGKGRTFTCLCRHWEEAEEELQPSRNLDARSE